MKRYERLQDLKALVGSELGTSDWVLIDQERIDLFARATGDHQWIHVDAERAAKGPYGGTVAHGFLTLSLLPALGQAALQIEDVRMGINYGLNKVRFPAPVRSGTRVRGRFKLQAFDPLPGGAQLTMEVTIEAEGGDKPVCIAEAVSRRYTQAPA
ncbi:MAG TPA: MaoC family dehydratase [Rubrivivax sp.]|nr:MaoC family dehydratase [Rubrivivax sp.]